MIHVQNSDKGSKLIFPKSMFLGDSFTGTLFLHSGRKVFQCMFYYYTVKRNTNACIALVFQKCSGKCAVWDVNQIKDSQNSCLVQNKLEKWSMVE